MAGGVEGSKFCLFLVLFPVRYVSSVSPRFHYRRHAFCFLPLAAILESPLPPYFWQSLQKHMMEKRQPQKWLSAFKKLELDPCLWPYTSINSKWIKDFNIRTKTLKLVQERLGNTLEAIDVGKNFLNRTTAAQQLRERMEKWDYIKLKSCTAK
jgi:hypothetical protein